MPVSAANPRGRKSLSPRVAILGLSLLVTPAPRAAAEEGGDAADLARKLSNPVADMVSIPFQFNWENGVGPDDDLRYVMNIQPVVPFSIGDQWNLIGRWIMPHVSQPSLGPGLDPVSGTGDIVFSAFFSPKESALVWGIGPVFSLPTTTDPRLGSGQWGAGPTVVVLKQTGPWTYGFLGNQVWSFAETGAGERNDVSQAFLQPFLAHTTGGGMTLTLQSESTANWEAEPDERWTVPVNVILSQVTRLGPFPFSVAAGAGAYVETPTGGPEWKIRTAFTLILPAGK